MNRYTFFIISDSFLLRMRNVSHKSCRENQNTRFMFSNFFSENFAIYEMKWKNISELGRPQMKIWQMCIACWVQKATDECSECVILIAFPLQQWLHECASVSHFTYIVCLVS